MMNHNGLTLWSDSSWRPLTEFRREMDRLFEDFWPTATVKSGQGDNQYVPACEVEEDASHYILALEMPGISKDDLKIEVIENQIVVTGERRQARKDSREGSWYSERRFGKFQRSFTLPAGIDAAKIEANYQDGILRLMVPKAESSKPRQIKIASGPSGFFGKLLGQPRNEMEEPHSSSDSRKEKVAS